MLLARGQLISIHLPRDIVVSSSARMISPQRNLFTWHQAFTQDYILGLATSVESPTIAAQMYLVTQKIEYTILRIACSHLYEHRI
jgi:hypothetical protein